MPIGRRNWTNPLEKEGTANIGHNNSILWGGGGEQWDSEWKNILYFGERGEKREKGKINFKKQNKLLKFIFQNFT